MALYEWMLTLMSLSVSGFKLFFILLSKCYSRFDSSPSSGTPDIFEWGLLSSFQGGS